MKNSIISSMAALIVSTQSAFAFPAATGARFDLICSGSRDGASGVVPFNTEFRIDLAAEKWCDGECRAIRNIAKVERDRLTLSDANTDHFSEYAIVDRTTGEYTQAFRSKGSIAVRSTVKATCEKAPFKAITYAKQKF